MKTQPLHFIDCQRELLRGVSDQSRLIARLKAWLAAAVIAAVGGWGVVWILIWMAA